MNSLGQPFLKYPNVTWFFGAVHLRGWVGVEQLECDPQSPLGQRLAAQVMHPGSSCAQVTDERQRVSRASPLGIIRQLATLAQQHHLHLVTMLTFEAAHIQEDMPLPKAPFAHFMLCEGQAESPLSGALAGASSLPHAPHAPHETQFRLVADSSGSFFDHFRKSQEHLLCGDVFEIVLSRRMVFEAQENPLPLFIRSLHSFKAPYKFFIPFIDRTLVGASPELLVEVKEGQVCTRPISGSVRRRMGDGSELTDHDRQALSELMASEKEKSELDMLIDLSRHDLHRVCSDVCVSHYREPLVMDSIIHTQATVTGNLLPGFSAIDAFFSCLNAGTLVGAPKRKAMQIIAELEQEPRGFYGGNLLHVLPDGSLRSLILIRTVEVKEKEVTLQAGATVLLGADARYEYWECGTKIRPWLGVVGHDHLCGDQEAPPPVVRATIPEGTFDLKLTESYAVAPQRLFNHKPVRLLLVDNEDSFTFNLESLFRSLGVGVDVIRNRLPVPSLDDYAGVLLSPGPSAPSDAGFLLDYVRVCAGKKPVFGVCLGFQAMVEALGGKLGRMATPLHGKARTVFKTSVPSRYLKLPQDSFVAARYHSLFAEAWPPSLVVTATDAQGIPMAIEAADPLWPAFFGVQFHPESALTGPVGRELASFWLDDCLRG